VKSPRSQNSRNKVHAKNTGFTVYELGWVVGYYCSYFVGWPVGLGLYVCGLDWVLGYENGPMDNFGLYSLRLGLGYSDGFISGG